MVPELKRELNLAMDREVHGESNVWSTAQRYENIYGCGVDARF